MIIGISGGSGSGKSTLAEQIGEQYFKGNVSYINQDNYYKDLSKLDIEDRNKKNFDTPEAFDMQMLLENLLLLKNGFDVEIPTYDFLKHVRRKEICCVSSKNIIIVDGILIYYDCDIRSLFDLKIFLDIKENVRLSRRLKRDVEFRGRNYLDIKAQWENSVEPMYKEYVLPTKKYADVVFSSNPVDNDVISIFKKYF